MSTLEENLIKIAHELGSGRGVTPALIEDLGLPHQDLIDTLNAAALVIAAFTIAPTEARLSLFAAGAAALLQWEMDHMTSADQPVA